MKVNTSIGVKAGAGGIGNITPLVSRLKRMSMPVVVGNCFVLLLCVMLGVFISSQGAPITCEAGSYMVGEPASITCNFWTDLSTGRRSFIIAHFKSEDEKIGDDVLVCHWSNQEYQCYVSNGYEFNGNITDRVTVRIPSATNSHAGLFACSFVPPKQTDETHACDFSVKDAAMDTKRGRSLITEKKPGNPSDPSSTESGDSDKPNVIVITVTVVCLCVVAVLVVVAIRKMRKKRNLLGIEDGAKQALLPNKQVQSQLDSLKLFKEPKTKKLMSIIEKEIRCGLDTAKQSATQTEADRSMQSQTVLKMYPICLPPLDKEAFGDFLVVDFKSKRVTVSDVKLRKVRIPRICPSSYPVKSEAPTGNQLFNFIAGSIDKFVRDRIPGAERRDAVFIISYPCQQTCLEKATLVKWTQEFSCQGVENEDLHGWLRKSLEGKQIGKEKQPCKVKFVAIVNDVVSTVVSVAHQNPKCRIGLAVGSGLNACYVESGGHLNGDGAQEQGGMEVVNTEVGALGENLCLEDFRTEFDRNLDENSSAPGTQILEKMVSWTYIGEIVRLILEHLRKEDLLLTSVPLGCNLFQNGFLTPDHVAEIDSVGERTSDIKETSSTQENADADGNTDAENPHSATERILSELGADEYTDQDIETVRNVCRLVCDRAAHLVGIVLASLINRHNQPGVIIVVDGDLNRRLPRFNNLMYTTANQLVNPELKNEFYLVSSFGRGNVGAARIAAAAKRDSQAAGTSQSQQKTKN